MGCGLAGIPAQPTCFRMMIPANANDGSRISCRAAREMPPQSASSELNCSRFALIWTIEMSGWKYFAGFGDCAGKPWTEGTFSYVGCPEFEFSHSFRQNDQETSRLSPRFPQVSPGFRPGYDPRQALERNSNLARAATRYKVDSAKIATGVRSELAKVKGKVKNESQPTKKLTSAAAKQPIGTNRKRSK